MKTLKTIFILSLLSITFYTCSSNNKFEKNYQKCKNNRTKCDTIYYYFKNVDNEERGVYIDDTLNNRLQTEYRMRFKKSNKYFYGSTNTHYKRLDSLNIVRLYKTKVIEKNKSFLRKKKSNLYLR